VDVVEGRPLDQFGPGGDDMAGAGREALGEEPAHEVVVVAQPAAAGAVGEQE
jgi:hypothetical protein